MCMEVGGKETVSVQQINQKDESCLFLNIFQKFLKGPELSFQKLVQVTQSFSLNL